MDWFYFVATASYFVTIVYVIYRLERMREDRIKENLRRYLSEEDIKKVIEEAINESELNQKMNFIILTLCTHIPELRKTKLCGE